MASHLEKLLRASITIAAQEKYIARIESQNDELRRDLAKAKRVIGLHKLAADIRRDVRRARENHVSIFHRPQAG